MLTVAYQGVRGSFSSEAAQTVFGPDIKDLPCREFRDVGVALASGGAQCAVLPVENSIAGSVLPAYDVLGETSATVIGEVTLLIRHFVLGVEGATLAGLRRVLSHPVALAQCSLFFQKHRSVEAVAVYDTAGAAQDVARLNDPQVAAIAARGAADLYGLSVLAGDVQDRNDNQTRFYVLGRGSDLIDVPAARRKTALLLETANQPGALVAVLEPFARAGVNLSKLESRPGITPWTYRFFVELDGAVEEDGVQSALEEVRGVTEQLRVLGSFAVLDGRRQA